MLAGEGGRAWRRWGCCACHCCRECFFFGTGALLGAFAAQACWLAGSGPHVQAPRQPLIPAAAPPPAPASPAQAGQIDISGVASQANVREVLVAQRFVDEVQRVIMGVDREDVRDAWGDKQEGWASTLELLADLQGRMHAAACAQPPGQAAAAAAGAEGKGKAPAADPGGAQQAADAPRAAVMLRGIFSLGLEPEQAQAVSLHAFACLRCYCHCPSRPVFLSALRFHAGMRACHPHAMRAGNGLLPFEPPRRRTLSFKTACATACGGGWWQAGSGSWPRIRWGGDAEKGGGAACSEQAC